MEKTRAKRGGETGLNGANYKGGQFLPNTTLPKMSKSSRKSGSGKEQIEPYKWELPLSDGMRSIMAVYGVAWKWEGPFGNRQPVAALSLPVSYWGAEWLAEAEEMRIKYMSGERWFMPEPKQ